MKSSRRSSNLKESRANHYASKVPDNVRRIFHDQPVNVFRTKALGPWLAEGKYVWLALATNLLALIVALRPGTSEPVIRITGLLLQVLGISTIIWGISETRALFGHASLTKKIKAWLQRFPLRRRHIVFGVGGGDFAVTMGKARAFVTHGAGANPTPDARLAALEKNIASIHERISATEAEIDQGLHKVGQEIKCEAQTRQTEDEGLRKKIEATGTGGLHISALGASWLFVGVTLSTAAPELAALFK
jgi:hypothetical protein